MIQLKRMQLPLALGLLAGLCGLLLAPEAATAAPVAQDATLEAEMTPAPPLKDCGECHLDIADHWSHSPHAHAFDDAVFQDWWQGQGKPGDCLLCHTTGYQASTGAYAAEGIICEGCHGPAQPDHPPAVIPVRADTEYCGTCHTTTLSEWRLTGHAVEDVGCADCHDPHSQKSLFEVADDLCINCHKEDMGDYLEDTHAQTDIGCVDCHALVIPPEETPADGIVPTGHQFTITTDTCVACHTDTLHAGFALPGYENGASAAVNDAESIEAASESGAETDSEETSAPEEASVLSPEQQLQALEAAAASRNLTAIFQGGVVGLALGGSTAWIVAHNVRRQRSQGEDYD